jgi:hypothetical protein
MKKKDGLMQRLKDILSGPSSAKADGKDEVAEIERAIALLDQEKRSARGELLGIADRRSEILLSEDDEAIFALDRGAEHLHLRLERVDLIMADLQPKLAAARAAARKDRLIEHYSACADALDAYIAAYGPAAEAFNAVMERRRAMGGAGFESEAATLPMIFPLVGANDLGRIADAIKTVREKCRRLASPPAAPVAHAPSPPVEPVKNRAPIQMPKRAGAVRVVIQPAGHFEKTPDGFRCVRGDVLALAPDVAGALVAKGWAREYDPVDPPKRPERRPLKFETAGDGEVLVTVLRAGYPGRDKAQCLTGDVIAIPAGTARFAVQNGACEYYEGGSDENRVIG